MNNYDVLSGHINNIPGPTPTQHFVANTSSGMITAAVFKAGVMTIANIMSPSGNYTATVRDSGNMTFFNIF
jgi:hypothetical protein